MLNPEMNKYISFAVVVNKLDCLIHQTTKT